MSTTLVGMSDDDLFNALTAAGRIDRSKATTEDHARYAVLSNERHRRAEAGRGRFGKLNGRTREIEVSA